MAEQFEANSSSPERPSTRDSSSSSSTYEYGQESFETFRQKVLDLCSSIGYGTPRVERLKGGSYNRIIGVTFNGEQKHPPCVIRIPRFRSDYPESQDIKNQLAILRAVESELPVAKARAYSLTPQNPIGFEYIIQERLPGVSLDNVYGDFSHSDKKSIVEQMVHIIRKIENIKYPNAGRLIASSPTPLPASSTSCHDISCPLEVTGFGTGYDTSDPNQVRVAPAKDLDHFFRSQFDAWESFELTQLSGATSEYWKELRKIYEEMIKLFELLAREGGNENVLFHVDLEPRNILVQQEGGKITGVLDWDGALSVPKVLGRKPPVWLWDFGDDPSDWDGDVDLLPPKEPSEKEAELKKLFDDKMELHSPGYREDAYYSGRWLRRLARFALNGFSDNEDIKRYETFVRDWEVERTIQLDKQAREMQVREEMQAQEAQEKVKAEEAQAQPIQAQEEIQVQETQTQEKPVTKVQPVQEKVRPVQKQKKRQIFRGWIKSAKSKISKKGKWFTTKLSRRGKQKSSISKSSDQV